MFLKIIILCSIEVKSNEIDTKSVALGYNNDINSTTIIHGDIKENITIKEIIKKHNIHISYKDYESYLKKNEYIPEYDTLSFYLIEKFKEKRVTTFDILDLLEKIRPL